MDLNGGKYIYPAKFVKEANETFSVYFPDLDGCQTYDDTLLGAIVMAKEALEGYIEVLLEDGETLPPPSNLSDIPLSDCEYSQMVVADIENKSDVVTRVLRIPKNLDTAATKASLDLSKVLENALINEFYPASEVSVG